MYDITFWQNPVVILVLVWALAWKGLALWRAASRGDKIWYIVMLVVNTLGLVEIVYLVATREK